MCFGCILCDACMRLRIDVRKKIQHNGYYICRMPYLLAAMPNKTHYVFKELLNSFYARSVGIVINLFMFRVSISLFHPLHPLHLQFCYILLFSTRLLIFITIIQRSTQCTCTFMSNRFLSSHFSVTNELQRLLLLLFSNFILFTYSEYQSMLFQIVNVWLFRCKIVDT